MKRLLAATTTVVTAALLCTLAINACDDDSPIAGPEALNAAGFPLAVGNPWEYGVRR